MTATPQILRFAALGDSLTAGLGDPAPGGGWRGWAALLAEGLTAGPRDATLLNVSSSGALTTDVAGRQLAEARLVRPHLASVLVGVNDTLRGSYDIQGIAQRLHTVLGTLRADGTVVLTACLPDPGQMLGLPEALARPLARRMGAVNAVVHALSERHGAIHVHLAGPSWVTDRALWSVDRLHPSELGHRLIAREFHAVLAAAGHATGAAPARTLDGPGPGRAAGAWWMATRGTKWIADRCTDLLPDLARLALLEVRHRMAGTDSLLDARARHTTAWALASLDAGSGPGLQALPGVEDSARRQRGAPGVRPGLHPCRDVEADQQDHHRGQGERQHRDRHAEAEGFRELRAEYGRRGTAQRADVVGEAQRGGPEPDREVAGDVLRKYAGGTLPGALEAEQQHPQRHDVAAADGEHGYDEEQRQQQHPHICPPGAETVPGEAHQHTARRVAGPGVQQGV
jgi:lysophospholipase L1-like esterase